jgi:hypothetical protein
VDRSGEVLEQDGPGDRGRRLLELAIVGAGMPRITRRLISAWTRPRTALAERLTWRAICS